MQTSVALRKPSFPVPLLSLLIALVMAFSLGGVSGYLVRTLATPISEARHQQVVSAAQALCPAGSHLVVWYTARVVTCAGGGSTP
jgi:hypothetical protein